MRTLGVSGGWMFFSHAGNAVAVNLASNDVTDVFSADSIPADATWGNGVSSDSLRRANLLARSVLAIGLDPLVRFTVPSAVRAAATQALRWEEIYERAMTLPIIASAPSLIPPPAVREAASQALYVNPTSRRAAELAAEQPLSQRLLQQMQVYFARHNTSPDEWGGQAGRTWISQLQEAQDQPMATSLAEQLADADSVGYDTLRLVVRAFSMVPSPHADDCTVTACACGGSKQSPGFPSDRWLTYQGIGGDEGRVWASRILQRAETTVLAAAVYDPDAGVASEDDPVPSDMFDGEQPHVYAPVPSHPEICLVCGEGEVDERHQGDAVNYLTSDITPTDAHYFYASHADPEVCEICGKAVDDTLHKQAALASYYRNKTTIDKQLAETQKYWDGKEQGVSAAAAYYGVDWIEGASHQEVLDGEWANLIDSELADLTWARRDNEANDPLAYYVSYTGDDPMSVDQIYATDGLQFYKLEPHDRVWMPTRLGTPEQLYEVDDRTALLTIQALAQYPDDEVDLREVDPGEALLMQECVPALDDQMLERIAIVSAADPGLFDYTPEERAKNAQRQVRDATGRFAKSGSRVAVGNKTGTVSKIDPATQRVEVQYDDGTPSAWVNAKGVNVVPQGAKPAAPNRPTRIDLSKIPAQPRATAHTPKAALGSLLPQMDRDALGAVIANYPNFIAKERAGANARRQAQQAQDKASRARWEAEQARAEADYKRRLEKIHAQGKKARDWIDRIYKKILPGYHRQAMSLLAATHRKKQQDAAVPTTTAAPAAPGQPITDPAQSDVAPVYMAEVDANNPGAVLELMAMVPASTTGSDPQILRFTSAGWKQDNEMLRKLRSTAPPAVVALDEAQFNDTLTQVKTFYTTPEGKELAKDEAKQAETTDTIAASTWWGEFGELAPTFMFAADSVEKQLARLVQYWTAGPGGDKIGWNRAGDMIRCTRHLKKYMSLPGQAEGFCASLHSEMNGDWLGDRRDVPIAASGDFTSPTLTRFLSTDEVISFSAMLAAIDVQAAGVDAPQSPAEVPQILSGSPFRIPILAPVGIRSGDGRRFAPLALTSRELPLPLMWQVQTNEGHDSSVIVGRIDSMERGPDGSLINARGVFDVGPYGQEAERLVRHKFLRGVSVDLDNFEAEAAPNHDVGDKPDEGEEHVIHIAPDEMTVTNGRVMGATLVPKPAFQECTIELDETPEEEAMTADGTYIGTPETATETDEMIRSVLVAAGIPLNPPSAWFADPHLTTETPLTVLDDGRVFGHIATWNTDHVGLPFSTRPPKSRSEYAYFHTGVLRTSDGGDVPVGQITLAGGHAGLDLNATMAVKHYDDTASAMCDVHAGEDAYGIWVAGALRPGVSGEQVRAMRAAAPSGDWRPINGRLELVAVCQVNVPGFPVTRARVASGAVYALVAAGTAVLNQLRAHADNAPIERLVARVDALEAPQRDALNAAREAAMERFKPVIEEQQAQLAAAREAARNRVIELRAPGALAVRERMGAMLSDDGSALFRDYSPDTRDDMAKKGQAMPNGGYPIANVADLKNAIRAYGRAASGEKAAVRRHIRKRARALGKSDLIPESWASMSTPVQEVAGEIEDLMARMSLIAAVVGRYPNGEPWDPGQHPRDEKGKFRQVIAELKKDLGDEAGTQDAVEGLDVVQQAANQGDVEAAQNAAQGVLDLVDKIAAKTADPGAVKTLREGYTSLATAVSNLPLVFGDLNQKYRFSDLPEALKGLIKDMYTRADALLAPEDLATAGGKLNDFMTGIDLLSQPEISAELSKLLRFLI